MAIPDHIKSNFETFCRAAIDGAAAIVECTDRKTGEPRYVICAVNRDSDDAISYVPFGHLSASDPYDEYMPPSDAGIVDTVEEGEQGNSGQA